MSDCIHENIVKQWNEDEIRKLDDMSWYVKWWMLIAIVRIGLF